jgi:hypothetical protein
VEPLSTTMISRCGYDWPTTEARHPGRWVAPFQLAMTTETSGRPPRGTGTGLIAPSPSVAVRPVFFVGSLKMIYYSLREKEQTDGLAQDRSGADLRLRAVPGSP